MKPKGSLKLKLRLMALIPVILFTILFLIFFIFKEYRAGLANYNDEGTALAKAYASSIENTIESLAQQFNTVVKKPAIVDETIGIPTRKTMLQEQAETSVFTDFSIAFSSGQTYNDTDISQREYFKQAFATKSYYVSSPVLRMTDNTVTIMMGRYFMTSDGREFVAYGGLAADTFSKLIDDVHFEENGIAFIIDKDGVVVGTSSGLVPQLADLTGGSTLDSDAQSKVAQMLASEEGYVRFTIGGQDYIVGYATVNSAEGWTVAAATPSAPLINDIAVSCVGVGAMAVVFLIIVIAVVSLIIKGVMTPISAATARLEKMAEGDVTSPMDIIKTGDETELMTVALNRMVEQISSYIADIKVTLTAVAGGDLTQWPSVDYHGDFTEIRNSMEMILSSLNGIMSDVSKSSGEVKKGASQLAEGSSGLSSGAASQASAVEEVTSTVQSMAAKMQENDESIKGALATAKNTDEQAHKGSKNMEEMLSAINEIEASAKQIGNIIKVIEDISFQTNILALNASVEAARAGAAGKGFAVVAGEVRNLAGKSADAAKQTNELITQSINAVNKGTQLADVTAQALGGIVDGVDKVTAAINDIARFNAEQNIAIGQISLAMDNVNQAIHNTTATAEESAAESEQLSSLADNLNNAVSRFRVK